MRRTLVLTMVFIGLFSMGIFVVLSVEEEPGQNDPRIDNRANACYEGGVLEALCFTTDVNGDGVITSIDTDHMWQVGWYYIRYQYRMVPFSVLQERLGWSTIVGTPQAASASAPLIPASNSSASSGNVPSVNTPPDTLPPDSTPMPTSEPQSLITGCMNLGDGYQWFDESFSPAGAPIYSDDQCTNVVGSSPIALMYLVDGWDLSEQCRNRTQPDYGLQWEGILWPWDTYRGLPWHIMLCKYIGPDITATPFVPYSEG